MMPLCSRCKSLASKPAEMTQEKRGSREEMRKQKKIKQEKLNEDINRRESSSCRNSGEEEGEGRRDGVQVVGMGRGMLVHLPEATALRDIFPTALCHSGIIAHDYVGDQRDRLSLISLTSVGEVIQAVTRFAPDMKS